MSEYDVVVAGGGMGGLTSALAAAEHGARVLLIEKGPELGGSMLLSGGLIWTLDGRDHLAALLPQANPELAGMVVDDFRDGLRWMRELGVTASSEVPLISGHGSKIDPRDYIRHAERLLLDSGATIATNTGLVDFTASDTAVSVQLVERGSGRTCVAETSALILATGGFQGSAELVTRYIHVSPHDIVLRASPWSTGDGLTAALRNGAVATRAMDQFYGHSLVDCEQGANLDEMRRLSQYYGCYAVALNLAGLRFADESRGTGEEILNQAVARQPEGTAYYVVDDRIARTVRLPEGDLAISGIQRAKAAGARVITADSLDELTLALSGEGLPLAAVRDTFAAYNDHVSGPMLPGLYPPRTKYRTPIEIAPFHAVRVRAAITFTMGGLSVDATMRLHRSAGTRSAIADRRPEGGTSGGEVTDAVFPNVFAAGCDIGDMSAGGYLGALATALVTGRIAGAQASALATR